VVSAVASSWDTMQAWSARRAASMETFETQNASLVASLGGTVDAFSSMMGGGSSSSTFISNDALSSSLFGGVSTVLAAEETIIAQVIYTRMMKRQQEQLGEIDKLSSMLDTLA
jgi:hypothetical protein